jgi:hypothetical protein
MRRVEVWSGGLARPGGACVTSGASAVEHEADHYPQTDRPDTGNNETRDDSPVTVRLAVSS